MSSEQVKANSSSAPLKEELKEPNNAHENESPDNTDTESQASTSPVVVPQKGTERSGIAVTEDARRDETAVDVPKKKADKQFPCRICAKICSSQYEYGNHMRHTHKSRKGKKKARRKEDETDKERTSEEITEDNNNAAKNSQKKDNYCGLELVRRKELDEHLNSLHLLEVAEDKLESSVVQGKQEKIFVCRFCSEEYRKQTSYGNHVRHKHKEELRVGKMKKEETKMTERTKRRYTSIHRPVDIKEENDDEEIEEGQATEEMDQRRAFSSRDSFSPEIGMMYIKEDDRQEELEKGMDTFMAEDNEEEGATEDVEKNQMEENGGEEETEEIFEGKDKKEATEMEDMVENMGHGEEEEEQEEMVEDDVKEEGEKNIKMEEDTAEDEKNKEQWKFACRFCSVKFESQWIYGNHVRHNHKNELKMEKNDQKKSMCPPDNENGAVAAKGQREDEETMDTTDKDHQEARSTRAISLRFIPKEPQTSTITECAVETPKKKRRKTEIEEVKVAYPFPDEYQWNMIEILKKLGRALTSDEQKLLKGLRKMANSWQRPLDWDFKVDCHVYSLPTLPSTSDHKFPPCFEDVPQRKKTRKRAGNNSSVPLYYSLLAPVRVPMDISGAELKKRCEVRLQSSEEENWIFKEDMNTTSPLKYTELASQTVRLTPIVHVSTSAEAHSPALKRFCQGNDMVIIRGLPKIMRMKMEVFNTKPIHDIIKDGSVELRHQRKRKADENEGVEGRSWDFSSIIGKTNMTEYARYQEERWHKGIIDEIDILEGKKTREEVENSGEKIKFGTNIDLSDENLFKEQMKEINKLPGFLRPVDESNLLTTLNHTIFGMNTPQMYMKVAGVRTPGHVENNCLGSINMNIGPGDCVWFGVPFEYAGQVEELCKKRGEGFFAPWWPHDIKDLAHVPIYRINQKPGDLMWVGIGTVHWVQATGGCNNISWNVGPRTATQLNVAIMQHEWNRTEKYQSLVPMQHMFWQLAKENMINDPEIYEIVKAQLIKSYAYGTMLEDYGKKRGLKMKDESHSGSPVNYCENEKCQIEVYTHHFLRNANSITQLCIDCAMAAGLTEHSVIVQTRNLDEMLEDFDRFIIQ